MTVRTDIHRPSAIQPENYDFVGIWYDPKAVEVVMGSELLFEEQENIREHMKSSGGRWSNHEHGGTCDCCGAHAVYLATFHHALTNTYINVGEECANKLRMGEGERFARARKAAKSAREAIAGKKKAQLILSELGLSRAWELYNDKAKADMYEENTVHNMVMDLTRYGNMSDKQIAFMRSLVHRIDNREAITEERKREKEAAAPCPNGRLQVTGTVLSTKWSDGVYGRVLKMMVKAEGGYTLWGTVPSALGEVEKGSVVTFKATIEPSQKDPKHGFFSRPSAQKQ
ncbi:MAG: hypothetical protein EBR82_81230 [Caulobacteraceae bacterium]|nr:hypothetical protein [Caulobacteraceae bacterium]